MQLLIGLVVVICVMAWRADDVLKLFVDPTSSNQAVVATKGQANSSSLRTTPSPARAAEPQVLSDEEFLELAKTDPQAAVRLYQISLQSVQLHEAQKLNNYLTTGSYDPKTLGQSLKNAVAKIDSSSETTEPVEADSLPPERKALTQENFRERVKSTDLAEAFQEYQQSYQAVERKEFQKLTDFLATGKYE